MPTRSFALRPLCTFLLLATCAAHAQDVDWYTLSVDGVRTGYARIEHGASADSEAVTLIVRELGHTQRVQRRIVFRHDAAGRPLGFDYELDSGIAQESWRGTFEHGALRIHASAARTPDAMPDLPADASFTPDRSARFRALWNGARTALDVVAFDPQRRSAGVLQARVVADEADGRHVHVAAASDSDAGEDLWFGADGRLLRAEEPLFGARATWTPCARDCDARVEAPLDFMGRMVVRSPVRIPDWFKHRTLRYLVTRTDGAPASFAPTGEQAVARGARGAVLTICADCGDATQATAEELARYLAPNAWVQSDNAEIRHLARNTAAPSLPVASRMRKFVQLVKQRMHGGNDFLGYGDAVGALHSGSGDCSEFAVLLAALARSQGIPTRIVMGVTYMGRFSGKKDVFCPHMWVQVWDGRRWISYDAALDGFDSTHIALAVGSGEPDEVTRTMAQLPLLRMEKAAVVRQR